MIGAKVYTGGQVSMDSTAATEQRRARSSGQGAPVRWASDMYDELLRSVIGDEALAFDEPIAGPISGTELLRAYAVSRVSRELDLRARSLQAQGRCWFAAAGAGREVIGWAFGRHLQAHDPKLSYYRDRTLTLCCGVTP